MQKKLEDWNDSVSVTGGILSPSKCWWYLVTFEYIRGRWGARTPQDREFQLWIKDECNNPVILQKIDSSTGMNMLGVKLAPDGNRRDHVEMLRNKADRWAMSMKGSNANGDEVWTAIHRTIPFALCYSLLAIPLTQAECNYIFAPIIKVGLPLAGIVTTIPRALRSSSLLHGGLGLIDPYLHLGVSQIVTLVSQIWKKSPTGLLLDTVLDDLALELGLSAPWQSAYLLQGLQYTSNHTWIHNTLQFSLANNIHIQLDEPSFNPIRKDEQTIMELALTTITTKATLRTINRVRMELQVALIWISDIASADGRHLDPRWLKQNAHYPCRNGYIWPIKHHTSVRDWQTWRRWLKSVCRDRTFLLCNPLRQWQGKREDWIPHWDCFVTATCELLYIMSQNRQGWQRHIIIPGRRHQYLQFYNEYLQCNGPVERVEELYRASAVHIH